MQLLCIMPKKIMVNGSCSSLILGFNLQAWLNFRVACGDHQLSHGTKTHIFDKFEAFCIQWYHFQLKIPTRNMFNRFFYTLKYFPASFDVWCFGAAKVEIINIYNPSCRSRQIFKQYESGTYFKGFWTQIPFITILTYFDPSKPPFLNFFRSPLFP